MSGLGSKVLIGLLVLAGIAWCIWVGGDLISAYHEFVDRYGKGAFSVFAFLIAAQLITVHRIDKLNEQVVQLRHQIASRGMYDE